MKYISIAILFLFTFTLSAQQQEKKVVVIKKEINENGKITTEEVRLTGEEADKHLEEMRKRGELENIDIDVMDASGEQKRVRIVKKEINESSNTKLEEVEQDLQVESVSDADGNVTSAYTLTTTKNGKVEVVKWDGTGEPPLAIKKILAETEVETIVVDEEGKEVSQKIEKYSPPVFSKDVYGNPINKASIGIGVDNHETGGVLINRVLEGSGAAKAGLLVGDKITQVNGKKIFTITALLESLNPYKGGEEISVTYIRDGETMTTKVILQSK